MITDQFDRNTIIPVLYRDEHVIAVHKPSGMVVHPTDLARQENVSLLSLVRRISMQRVWPVHRLDRPTSGVLLFALSREVASHLGRQFRQHEVKKRYLALVRGIPDEQIIDYPLKDLPYYRSDHVRSEPLDAVTHIKVEEKIEIAAPVGRYPTSRYALVKLSPVTGRRHQLRRHMKHLSHPIIGDTTYGDGVHNRYFREYLAANRLLLAAVELVVKHPVTGHVLAIKSAIDKDFETVLERLGADSSVWRVS